MKKKHIKFLCALLAMTMLTGLFLPAFAEGEDPGTGEPTVQSIDINANYYAGDTDNTYSIAFTIMEEIPAFTQLSLKIRLANATADQASFDGDILTGGTADVVRGSDYAIFPLTYTEAKTIPAKTRLCTLTVTSEDAPSAENLTISEFSIVKENETEATPLTANITVAAGPIVPELDTETQAVYDALCALPNLAAISFYQQDGSLTDLAALKETADSVKDSYTSLSASNRTKLDTVMEFYGKTNYTTASPSLSSVLQGMLDARGLIEIAKTTESITAENALSYQFLIHTFDAQKGKVSLEGISPNPVAYAEINQVLTTMETASATVSAALESAGAASDGGYEKKVLACKSQIDIIQGLSSHKYYSNYMTDLESQIAELKDEIEVKYPSESPTKTGLLLSLEESSSLINLIKKGVQDLPAMEIEEVNLRSFYDIVFTRKNAVSDSLTTSVSVVVTDKNGKQIDSGEASFPSSQLKLELTMTASADTYVEDETYTFTAYYHVNGAKFLIGSQEETCVYYPVTPAPGLGTNTNTGLGIGGTTAGNTTTGPTTGGTIFPDSNDEPEIPSEPEESNFHDIGNYTWATEAINTLYEAGIINGMEDGVFNPAGQVTREQFCKMVVELFDIPTGTSTTAFSDVKSDAWYAPYITAAMQAGYVQGQSGEYFGIGESIMRQDMAVILYRALGDQNSKAVLYFSDKEAIAPYAEDAIAELVGLGIINGYEDGSFQPRGTATRAEAAKMIYGIYQYLND